MEPPFVANAGLTDAELALYQTWRSRRYYRGRSSWTPLIAIAFVLALALASLSVALGDAEPRGGASLAALFMGAIFAGIYLPSASQWRPFSRQERNRRSRYDGFFDLHYELSVGGLRTTRRGEDARYDWAIFLDVVVADGLLLLCQSDWDATPIPLRGFTSPEVAAAAVAFAKVSVTCARAEQASTA